MASTSTSSSAASFRRTSIAWIAILVWLSLPAARSADQRFFPDDPLWTDDDRAIDASNVAPVEDTNGYDFLVNTVGKPGERRDVRALNVNTVDEVPDSSWFTNRIGRTEMSVPNIVRGPDRVDSITVDGWVVSGGKGSGVQPGFRMSDPAGQIYQIEVDPPANPELASGAEIIGTAFYHAFGYYVVDVYLAEIDRASLVISEKATIRDPLNGKRRALKKYDLDAVFERAAKLANGRYRVLVSRFAPGRPLGNFRYYSTRPDDPNDVVAHEHRRELRGARVFAAWLNHDDSRGVNSLDFLETTNGRSWVKHYMFDFGSILGSGTISALRHRPGNEYIYESKPGWLSLITFGLYVRPWMTIDYPEMPPSVGRIEADRFNPVEWKPEYPNPAFDNMRPDDAFWAARIVSKFSDQAIRAVVEKAKYSDSAATDYLTKILITRRDKVMAVWLNQVCPVVDATLSSDGTLRFSNAAIQARVATPVESYELQWFSFDNVANTSTPIGTASTAISGSAQAPAAVLTSGQFVGVSVKGTHAGQPGWTNPSTFFFRRGPSGGPWTLVGVERGRFEGERPN